MESLLLFLNFVERSIENHSAYSGRQLLIMDIYPLTFSLSLFALYIREAEGLHQRITGQWHFQAMSLEYLKELSGRPWLPILKSIVYFLMANMGSEP